MDLMSVCVCLCVRARVHAHLSVYVYVIVVVKYKVYCNIAMNVSYVRFGVAIIYVCFISPSSLSGFVFLLSSLLFVHTSTVTVQVCLMIFFVRQNLS